MTAFLTIPAEIRLEFWQDSLQKNRLSLLMISTMIFGMELFNIVRVLFFSASGLRSVNNRIYFGMYCLLIMGAALALLLQHLLRRAPLRTQWGVQAGAAGYFLLWHIGFNVYDLARNPTAGVYLFLTAIVGLAMFIQMPYAMSTFYFGLGYAVFMVLSAPMLDMGSIINLTMTTIVMLAISFTRCRHAVIELCQRREIAQINEQLQQMLQKDPLTGLLNKTAAQARIAHNLESCAPEETFLLFMMDLDNFKFINDHYGHPCGDHVLVETARRLRSVFFDAVCAGRIGGDEFLVLLSADGGEHEARSRQLLEELSNIRWMEQPLDVACSIGVLRVARPGARYEQLYAAVDAALYEAKQRGKSCCCFREIS